MAKMNINDLKKMIAEEYKYWMAEQDPAGGMDMDMPAPMPGGGSGAPKVDVGPDDIDMGGDENPEETLRDIYDMLKDYFEGGGAEDMDEKDEEEPSKDEEEEEEEVTEKKEDDKKAKNESRNKKLNESKKKKQLMENIKRFKSKSTVNRLQKLANIK
tara:strand:- start:948 stop:1418 length:471 start_codon:yes stop_codon:yes gene_type:complete